MKTLYKNIALTFGIAIFFLCGFSFASASYSKVTGLTQGTAYQLSSSADTFLMLRGVSPAGGAATVYVGSTSAVSFSNYDAYTFCNRGNTGSSCFDNTIVPAGHYYLIDNFTSVSTDSFYTPLTSSGGGSSTTTSTTTITVDNSVQGLFYGYILFLIGLALVIWIMRRKSH